jgi:hypothetical protein
MQTENLAEMQAAQRMIDFRNLKATVHPHISTWKSFAWEYHTLEDLPHDCQRSYYSVQELAGTRIITHNTVQELQGGGKTIRTAVARLPLRMRCQQLQEGAYTRHYSNTPGVRDK